MTHYTLPEIWKEFDETNGEFVDVDLRLNMEADVKWLEEVVLLWVKRMLKWDVKITISVSHSLYRWCSNDNLWNWKQLVWVRAVNDLRLEKQCIVSAPNLLLDVDWFTFSLKQESFIITSLFFKPSQWFCDKNFGWQTENVRI